MCVTSTPKVTLEHGLYIARCPSRRIATLVFSSSVRKVGFEKYYLIFWSVRGVPTPTSPTRACKHQNKTRKHTDTHADLADHMDTPRHARTHARTHGCIHSQHVRAHAVSTGNRPMRMCQLTANMLPATTRLHSSGRCPVTSCALAGENVLLHRVSQSAVVGTSSEANGLCRSHPACGRRTITTRAAHARTRGVSVTRDLMLSL
jgi:hypothetical protein